MSDTEINDKRNQKDFKGITFSKFQKVKVKRNSLIVLRRANWRRRVIGVRNLYVRDIIPTFGSALYSMFQDTFI